MAIPRSDPEYNIIESLRRIDKEIDFARGYLQLSILLELGRNGNGLTVRDLAKKLNERSKSVADALRKMVLKNIVIKTKNGGDYEIYTLTEHGKSLYEDLVKILRSDGDHGYRLCTQRKIEVTPHDFSLELIKKDYVVDAIIAIATSKKRLLGLKEIAGAMGLSIQRAQAYIDMFSSKDSAIRIFKKIEPKIFSVEQKNTWVKILEFVRLRKQSNKVCYTLTDDGLTIFHKLPFYTKYGTSRTAKVIQKLAGTLHPRLVAKKLFRLITIINIAATTISMAIISIQPIASLAVLLTSMVLTTATMILYIATYNL